MESQLRFDESVGVARVPTIRSGDVSNSMTVMCTTTSRTAMGSVGSQLLTGTDFISKEEYPVEFDEGQTTANCDIRVSAV